MARPTMTVDGVGAFVGVDGFDVGVVPGDVVIEQDAVAAQDVPGHGADFAGRVAGVQFGQRGVFDRDPSLCLQLRHSGAHQLHAGNVAEHVRELVLDQLDRASGRPNC